MSKYVGDNKRLVKNTLTLYGRMFLTAGVSFYSTRLILYNLGVDNYGIYNVIGGFVSMFYMLTSNMTQSVGRFLTFELGTGDKKKLQQTFSASLIILISLSLVVLLLAETVGLWFVNNKLNISHDRIEAANWIYQFTVISFIIELIGIPYCASIISHEKISAFAFVTIIKVLLTLGIALLLSVSPIDKLVLYGILLLLLSISIQIIYWIYCRRNFQESRFSLHIKRSIFKNMFRFAGWNFLTTCSAMLCSQGVNIIFNIYFGPFINAAKGIASQVNGVVFSFANNFTTALNPQITKSYASKDIEHTRYLVCNGAKYSYLLLFIVGLPCIIEIDFILSIWLVEIPDFTAIFIRLTILNSLVEVLLNSTATLNKASGKIRNFQILVSITQMLILIFSYLIIRSTGNVIWTVLINNIMMFIIFIPRILINRPFSNISFSYFYNTVLKGVIIVTLISFLISLIPTIYINEGWMRIIIVTIISTVTIVTTSYIYILNKEEKNKIHVFLKKHFLK